MKIKALVTMLVLGSSSMALADSYGPAVRDHRAPVTTLPAPVQAPVVQGKFQFGLGRYRQQLLRPVLLANNTKISGWSTISVPTASRAFTKLELRANTGHTDIDRVMITFGNGQRQVVSLRGKADGKITARKSLTIDLDGGARNVKSVMLIGTSGRRASIDVLAV
jgi:hypothetical protein